jgi:hypothetical protein
MLGPECPRGAPLPARRLVLPICVRRPYDGRRLGRARADRFVADDHASASDAREPVAVDGVRLEDANRFSLAPTAKSSAPSPSRVADARRRRPEQRDPCRCRMVRRGGRVGPVVRAPVPDHADRARPLLRTGADEQVGGLVRGRRRSRRERQGCADPGRRSTSPSNVGGASRERVAVPPSSSKRFYTPRQRRASRPL